MRLRAALIATLLNVIVCSLLIAACTITAANIQNNFIEEEMRIICRLTGDLSEKSEFQDAPLDYLNGISEEGNILFAYFEKDGTVAYKNSKFDFDIPFESVKSHSSGDHKTFKIKNEFSEKFICVSKELNDGTNVMFAKKSVIAAEAMGGFLWVMILIVIGALITQFVIIYRCVARSDNMVDSIMRVLEDFTEGKFDSRIKGAVAGSQTVAAKYNATLNRVQDRVFRQQRKNRIFGQVINQMKTGIITVDNDLMVGFTTNITGDLFGVDTTDAENQHIGNVFNNEELEKAFTEAMGSNTGNMYVKEIEGRTPAGGVRPLRIYASPLYREGESAGVIAVIEDITEIRKLEQLRTDFAANVSHEMKTPLTSIKGFVETLQAGAVDNPEMARKFLNIIMIEADRLTRLINDILSITKMESGNENVEIKKIALDRAVMEVCDLLKIHADEKEVKVYASPNATPSFIMGNPDRVKQLLINLIENAIKYNKVGGTVTVKVIEDERHIYLSVSDTGIGVKEEHLNRLFERFYRVDKGRSRAMGGTGLGLAIVKHIVNSMGGFIEVSSKYGEGTEFLITLLKAEEEAPQINENNYENEDTEEE
ncbi:MAG: PAS domain S-box protein [Clostridia bacterium]|nr:PAS domain S-box protein [Clostridia bacterium]